MKGMDYGKYVGKCIRAARLQSQISKKSMERRLGICHRALNTIERGEIEIPPQRLTQIIYHGIMNI
ncbi:MAG: helix-turn-helix domain-containing protein [Rickettsiales bacterium]|nr:helix-turn-helix domain-containing protein [Rickettsiales bacterium]